NSTASGALEAIEVLPTRAAAHRTTRRKVRAEAHPVLDNPGVAGDNAARTPFWERGRISPERVDLRGSASDVHASPAPDSDVGFPAERTIVTRTAGRRG